MNRLDLNRYHLLARGGIISNQILEPQLLLEPNKNNWLPVHLAKNKSTAQWLYNLTINEGIYTEKIVLPALINNAQSIQTKYGQDLMTFLIEQNFTPQEAKIASIPPNTQSRIDLSLFWLSLARLESFETTINPIQIALTYSNSYFFMALHQLVIKNPKLRSLVNNIINLCNNQISDTYLVVDRAFQLQQILIQHFDIEKKINYHIINGVNKKTNNAIENLEGF